MSDNEKYMTYDQVKQAFNNLWLLKKKIGFCEIKISEACGVDKYCIVMLLKKEIKVLDTIDEFREFINQF